MSEAQTIELRRYPSRKLYNKNASSYVRLPEVAEMVRAGASIRVEDTETGEDVTRQVLLQIIMEQENHSEKAILSSDLMMDMIRMHQSKASEMMTGLFEQSVAFMRAQQEQIASQMSSAVTGTLTGMGAGMPGMPGMGAAQPWSMFDPAAVQEMQRQYQSKLASLWAGALPVMPGMPGAARKAETASGGASGADVDEIRSLRERLEELEKKLG